ncbi:MAG: kelch repeat-containing protein, partial [Thermoplasmata archaeon]|nr:kelch repeat-containing protein [Thermoplasmata archaeon]
MRLRSAAHGLPRPALASISRATLAVLLVALVSTSGLTAVAGSSASPTLSVPSPGHPFAHTTSNSPVTVPAKGCAAQPCAAAGGHPAWTALVGAPQPPARTGGVLAYDAADAFTLLFGGYEGYARPHHDLNDTWILRAGVWQLITPPISPSPREEAAFATDPTTGCLLMFGGLNDSSHQALGDTWGFCGTSWASLSVTTSPSPRYGAAAATDLSCSCVLLFGGRVSTSGAVLGDTWRFSSGLWTQSSPGTSPPPRLGAQMAWNNANQSVLLFGGSNGSAGSTFNDSWSYSSLAWHPLTLGASPPSRTEFGLAGLPGAGGVLLTGGEASGTYYNDTWQFTAGAWTQLTIVGAPPARSGLGVAYDAADNYPILFGGENASSLPAIWYGESWVFGGSQVRFDEVGLSPDTIWLVSLNGSTNLSTTSTVGFVVGNGSYTYTVGLVTPNAYGIRYAPARPAGLIHVHGSATRVPVVFGEQFYLRTAVTP